MEILPLASGRVKKIELPLKEGRGGFAGRIDGIKALNRVLDIDIDEAHEELLNALDDDYPDVRIAALKAMPSFSLRKSVSIFQFLSDRLIDENESVRDASRDCLKLLAPIFPSGCENILRRELRNLSKEYRGEAFEALRLTAKRWPETGCLHLDELIREEDEDLRRRGSKILKTIASSGGATGWDLISWSLQDEDLQVRRNASQTFSTLARSEPRIATILVEAAIGEEDKMIRKNVIRTLKKLDLQNPRVTRMIIDGARSRDVEMRKACVSQLSIILSGDRLREIAEELLRHETNPELRKKLTSLSIDITMEGTEIEKNKFLAPLEYVEEEIEKEQISTKNNKLFKGEDDKQELGRRNGERLR
jgi:3-methyladenine DNA glycosylase AlkC